ncbi:hypothetical protein [Thermoanaerobacter sp. YS13]|uniref:hypothetical protein n=1 Tax=Thermoanaerobacter sp. YS13 TaxID=1511746 RepID=UPI000AE3C13F
MLNHEKALCYADLGVKTCIEAGILDGLSLLYFRKGIELQNITLKEKITKILL